MARTHFPSCMYPNTYNMHVYSPNINHGWFTVLSSNVPKLRMKLSLVKRIYKCVRRVCYTTQGSIHLQLRREIIISFHYSFTVQNIWAPKTLRLRPLRLPTGFAQRLLRSSTGNRSVRLCPWKVIIFVGIIKYLSRNSNCNSPLFIGTWVFLI